jgi:hypothetical protein
MKGIIKSLLIGAAVAGVIYYLKDNEQVKKALGKAKDVANDTLGKINWDKAGRRVANSVAEQV